MVRQDHVARLLTADIITACPHLFQHIAVAYLRADEVDPLALQESFKPEIGHDCGDQPIAAQHSCLGPTAADQCHDLNAVDDLSLPIHDDQPVGIDLKRNPNIRPGRHYRFLAGGGCRRTAPIIDVKAIGADRTEEHTSDLQSLMRISYAVFCLKKKKTKPRM